MIENISVGQLLELLTGIGIIWAFIKMIKEIRKPRTDWENNIVTRLDTLQDTMNINRLTLASMSDQILNLEHRISKVDRKVNATIKGVKVANDHHLTGNHTKEMAEVNRELDEIIYHPED